VASRHHAVRTPPARLLERYDALLLDLDGVLYRGDRVIDGVPETLHEIRGTGLAVLFLTNNSARTPEEVASRLHDMGISARPDEVLTSALATAAMLKREGADGASAFVIGERGIREALAAVGVVAIDGEPDRTDLVVVGWDRAADYAKLRTACLLVERGARLVATNPDASFPAADGMWPGAGALLAAITTTTGADPIVVGKPARPMFDAAAEITGATRPLMVGDRLDTDVSGAAAMSWDSVLVLTGTARPPDLLDASDLPVYVAQHLSAVLADRIPGRFRPAEPTDGPAIRDLLVAGGLSDAGVAERLDGTTVCPSQDDAGGLVATASLTDEDGARVLRSVAVRREARGQSLGLLAVAAAVRLARASAAQGTASAGDGRIFLYTDQAQRFFERLGFEPVSREDLPGSVRAYASDEGCAGSAVPMARRR
jgi:glycerol 3-phosphatase-2